MDTPRAVGEGRVGAGHNQPVERSIEAGVIASADKIRLAVVLFLFVVAALTERGPSATSAVAFWGLSLWAVIALIAHFLINWEALATKSLMLLAAGGLIVGDLVCLWMFVYGMGGIYSGFQVLFLLDIILAAMLFTGLELAIVTGMASVLYAMVATISGASQGSVWAASTTVMSYLICAWLAHLLAVVVRREKAANERIIRHLAEAVLLLDADGRILVANPQVAAMFGIGPAELLGRLSCDVQRTLMTPEANWLFEDAIQTDGETPATQEACFTRDGERVIYRRTTVPCADPRGRLVGRVILCQDITDLATRAQAGEVPVPHDLAAALADMRAVSEALSGLTDCADDVRRRELVSVVRDQTAALRDLVAGLLEVNLIRDDGISLELRPIDASQLVATARRLTLLRAEQRGVELVSECAAEAGLIRADEQQLWRVLAWGCNRVVECAAVGSTVRLSLSLASGAVRFVAETPQTEGGTQDTLGAPSADCPDASECERIVALHGGQLYWANDSGLRFVVRLPFAGPTPEHGAAAELSPLRGAAPSDGLRDSVQRAIHCINNELAAIGGHTALAVAEQDIGRLRKALREVASSVHKARMSVSELETAAGCRATEGGSGALLLGLEAAVGQVEALHRAEGLVVIRHYPRERVDVHITPQEATELFVGLLDACAVRLQGRSRSERPSPVEVAVTVGQSCFTNDANAAYVTILPADLSEGLSQGVAQGSRSPCAWFGCESLEPLQAAEAIVARHGGRLRPLLHEDALCGCQVYLPMGPVAPPAPRVEDPMTPGGRSWNGMRVLVCEDNESLADIYERYLVMGGCQVTRASDGARGLEALRLQDFDLVITDIVMPEASGDEIVAAVNAGPAPCPVIVLTGQLTGALQEICIAEGAFALLHKPFRLSELGDLVTQVCDLNNARLETRRAMIL